MKKLLILTVAVCLFPSLVFSQNFDRTYPTIGRNCASMKESSARFQLSLNDSQNQNRSTQVTVDSLGNVVSSNVDFAGSGSL